MSNRDKIAKILECDYQCEAGPLRNNADWIGLVEELYWLRAEQLTLEKWAAFCRCCAVSGEVPCTREEFETREAAEKPKEPTHATR